jgi:putative oxidoreductase
MHNKKYPFLTLNTSVVILRVIVALIFMAHAIVRLSWNTVDGFGNFLEQKGFPFGVAIVWVITLFEIIGGILLILGYFKKWIALGLIVMLAIGILIIHLDQGWFNGEFGTGGCEYSVVLIGALMVIASADVHTST